MRIHYGDGPRMREYAPPSVVTESSLIHGYRLTNLTVPCACGGTLTAPPSDSKLIRFAVGRHQRTPRHVAWCVRNGMAAPS